MSRDILVLGAPVPQGSKFLARGRMIDVRSGALNRWRRMIAKAITDKGWHDDPILTGPVAAHLTFYLPRPGYHYGTGRNANRLKDTAPVLVDKRPDVDKLSRAVLDAITQSGAWRDDSQVAHLCAEKHYAEQSGVRIVLNPLVGLS
jgi:Holliday junction resolvase RusA-like endonuclease